MSERSVTLSVMPYRAKEAVPAPAAPDPAECTDPVSLFALRAERDLLVARAAALKAAEQLWQLPAHAPIGEIAAAADRLTSASGVLWMHARRVEEARAASS